MRLPVKDMGVQAYGLTVCYFQWVSLGDLKFGSAEKALVRLAGCPSSAFKGQ